MNQIVVRAAQTVSIAAITAFFLAVARIEVTQTYLAAAVVVAVVLTAFGTWSLQWLLRRWRGGTG